MLCNREWGGFVDIAGEVRRSQPLTNNERFQNVSTIGSYEAMLNPNKKNYRIWGMKVIQTGGCTFHAKYVLLYVFVILSLKHH